MYGNVWPNQFETSLEDVRVFFVETGVSTSQFGPLSLGFENRIIAYVVATTLVP